MTYQQVAVCQSLVEFCSLLFKTPRCFGKLQDPRWSGFLCGARMDTLQNPDLYVNT